jgi:hypothetical protein
VALEEVVGGRSLAAEPCLFVGVHVLADLILVAEGKKLALLVVENLVSSARARAVSFSDGPSSETLHRSRHSAS